MGRGAVAVVGVFVVVVVLSLSIGGVLRSSGESPSEQTSLLATSTSAAAAGDEEFLQLKVTNEYPTRLSKHWYVWDYIVEPHKTTTLAVSSGGASDAATFQWTLKHEEDGATVEDYSTSGVGLDSITFSFTRPAQVRR